jgi:hypothetical protein
MSARGGAWAWALLVLLPACATRQPPLYLWETFPRQQYAALLGEGLDAGAQIAVMNAHAEKARGADAALPPGFRAHLGLLHHNAGDLDSARAMWLAEKAAFPESAPYMDRLLRRLEAPPAADKRTGDPA